MARQNQTDIFNNLETSRAELFSIISKQLVSLVGLIRELHEHECQRPPKSDVLRQLSQDALLISSLCVTILKEGHPGELIFISESGKKIDLKDVSVLDDGQLADIVLNNLKK